MCACLFVCSGHTLRLSHCLSVFVCLSVCLSDCLFLCIFLCLSVCLSLFLSVFLSYFLSFSFFPFFHSSPPLSLYLSLPDTSDVQRLVVTLSEELSNVSCFLLRGSDARGCSVSISVGNNTLTVQNISQQVTDYFSSNAVHFTQSIILPIYTLIDHNIYCAYVHMCVSIILSGIIVGCVILYFIWVFMFDLLPN